MTPIVIIGSSGHAKVVIEIVERLGRHRIVGLIDRFRAAGEKTSGHAVLGCEADLPQLADQHSLQGFIVAIGDNFMRGQVADSVQALLPGLSFCSAVHPSAVLARDVAIGAGSVVMAGALIGPGCVIGRGCIVNTRASLDHDGELADFASLAPGVTTGGHCAIGAFTAIGIGATLAHRIRVGEHSVIGAGATVLRPIEDHCIAYGTPAKFVRPRGEGDRYL